MYRTDEKCKNCGGEYGLHHAITEQCPFGGIEGNINLKQIWVDTKFEPGIPYDTLKAQRDELLEACKMSLEGFLGILEYEHGKGASNIYTITLEQVIANAEKEEV